MDQSDNAEFDSSWSSERVWHSKPVCSFLSVCIFTILRLGLVCDLAGTLRKGTYGRGSGLSCVDNKRIVDPLFGMFMGVLSFGPSK